MNHTKLIQDSTKAYMIAYNQAMQETRNPNMASQIASVVTMSYMKQCTGLFIYWFFLLPMYLAVAAACT